MERFDIVVRDYTSWLDNPYVSGALTVFLIVYASMAAPKLPSYIASLFDYTLFKLFIFFLIVYISKRNATVALIAAIALMVSIMTLDRLKVGQEMMEVVKNDGRSRKLRMGNCVCECDNATDLSGEDHVVKTEEGHLVLHEAKKLEAENALHPAHVAAIAKEIAHVEKKGLPVLAARTDEGAKHMQEIAKAENNGLVSEHEAKKLVAKIVVHEMVMGTASPHEEHNMPAHNMLAHTDLHSEIHASADHGTQSVNLEHESSMAPVHTESRLVHPENIMTHEDKRMARAEKQMVKKEHPIHAEHRMTHEEHDSKSSGSSMAELAHEVLKRKQEETARRGVEPSSEELRKICAGVLNEYRHSLSCGTDCKRKHHGHMVAGLDYAASSYGPADH